MMGYSQSEGRVATMYTIKNFMKCTVRVTLWDTNNHKVYYTGTDIAIWIKNDTIRDIQEYCQRGTKRMPRALVFRTWGFGFLKYGFWGWFLQDRLHSPTVVVIVR